MPQTLGALRTEALFSSKNVPSFYYIKKKGEFASQKKLKKSIAKLFDT
jgi:hypothetical protein